MLEDEEEEDSDCDADSDSKESLGSCSLEGELSVSEEEDCSSEFLNWGLVIVFAGCSESPMLTFFG